MADHEHLISVLKKGNRLAIRLGGFEAASKCFSMALSSRAEVAYQNIEPRQFRLMDKLFETGQQFMDLCKTYQPAPGRLQAYSKAVELGLDILDIPNQPQRFEDWNYCENGIHPRRKKLITEAVDAFATAFGLYTTFGGYHQNGNGAEYLPSQDKVCFRRCIITSPTCQIGYVETVALACHEVTHASDWDRHAKTPICEGNPELPYSLLLTSCLLGLFDNSEPFFKALHAQRKTCYPHLPQEQNAIAAETLCHHRLANRLGHRPPTYKSPAASQRAARHLAWFNECPLN